MRTTKHHSLHTTEVIMWSFLILTLACVLAACNSGASQAVGSQAESYEEALIESGIPGQVSPFPDTVSSPVVVEPLSDSTTLTVWQVEQSGRSVIVYYTYERTGESAQERILNFHRDAEHFLVYDGNGSLLSGYGTRLEKDGDILFSYVQNQSVLALHTSEEQNSPVSLSLIVESGRETVAFTGVQEMAAAARILEQEEQALSGDRTLTPEEQDLLERAEQVKSWGPYLSMGEVDVNELNALSGIRDDNTIIGPDQPGGDQEVATVIQWICRVAKLLKYVCEYIDMEQICAWVRVVDATCTAMGIR